jgi:hypothetical protein
MFGRNRRSIPGGTGMFMGFRSPVYRPIELPPPPPPLPEEPPQKKSMMWGAPTWFFLHTIAEKVKPDSFTLIRGELLRHVYSVCTNLPCPICAKHAKMYLDSINFNAITTKNEFKLMLFTFHNVVNLKKNHPVFQLDELDKKYSLANTHRIFTHFILHFNDTYRAPGMIADDLFRKQLSKTLIEWFTQNSVHFN